MIASAGHPGAFDAIARMVDSFGAHGCVMRCARGLDGSLAGAAFSPAPEYRYLLWRAWDADRPLWTFGMLNPSTADHEQLDPTVTRCMTRACRGGAGGFVVWNLFAYRATDPVQMKIRANPVGPENNNAILYAVRDAALNIAAWGVDGAHRDRASEVAKLLGMAGIPLHTLGFTKDGFPRHPLYVSSAAPLQPWSYAA